MIITKVLYIKKAKKMLSFTKKVLSIQTLNLNQITTKKKIYFFLVTIDLLKY